MLEFVISSLDAHEVIRRDLDRPALVCEAPAPPPYAEIRLPEKFHLEPDHIEPEKPSLPHSPVEITPGTGQLRVIGGGPATL